MKSSFILTAAAASLANALALPEPAFDAAALPVLEARQGNQACRNQSCLIATIAGSTGVSSYTYSTYPTGDTYGGDCCVIRHFPAAKEAIFSQRQGLEPYCAIFGGGTTPVDSNPPGITKVTIDNGKRELKATSPCRPNILIFVKGTFEPGDTGIILGPQLTNMLDPTKWQVVGVNYDNSLDGIYCLGLPGGKEARATLAQVTSQCPNSQIAFAGYSQGAMAVRNALARAPIAQVNKVKNVITFGDPFCGARIGQYTGPINIFCGKDDAVCDGQLNITAAHLAYGDNLPAAAAILKASQKNF